MSTEKSSHSHAKAPKHFENSTDATRGEPLALRANTRKLELEKALEKLPTFESRERTDIETALGALKELMTGDVQHLSDTTAASINRWLESVKHLAEKTPTPKH